MDAQPFAAPDGSRASSPGVEAPSHSPVDDLIDAEYSVGRVEALTGIASATLRVWERRYGRPVAARRPSGHRRYSVEQVRWLRRVAEALACGHRPGQVVRLEDAALAGLLATPPSSGEDLELQHWMGAVREGRGDALAESLREGLATAAAADRVCQWMDTRLALLLHRIGQEWAARTLDIRHEHLASHAIEDVLRRAEVTERTGKPSRPRVLLASLPGERHRLGLQMARLACRSAGAEATVLGDDAPLDEIVAAAVDARATVVGVGTSLGPAGSRAARLVVTLRARLSPSTGLVVGGSGARLRRLPGVSTVTSLEEFGRWLDTWRPAKDGEAAVG